MKQSFDWNRQIGRYAPMIWDGCQKLFAILDSEIGLTAGFACAIALTDTLTPGASDRLSRFACRAPS
jgi:hypothetical protein